MQGGRKSWMWTFFAEEEKNERYFQNHSFSLVFHVPNNLAHCQNLKCILRSSKEIFRTYFPHIQSSACLGLVSSFMWSQRLFLGALSALPLCPSVKEPGTAPGFDCSQEKLESDYPVPSTGGAKIYIYKWTLGSPLLKQ